MDEVKGKGDRTLKTRAPHEYHNRTRIELGGWPWPPGFDGCPNAAAGAELCAHHSPDWIASLHHVFKDLVDDVFLKDAEIAVAK